MLSFLDEETRQSALLIYKAEGASDSRVRPIVDLPDVTRVLKSDDLGTFPATGWLEETAIFSDPKVPGHTQ